MNEPAPSLPPRCKGSPGIIGFTLVEVLVACGVTALIAVLAMRLLGSVNLLWQMGERRADTFAEARAAVGLIHRDLRFAAPSGDGSPTLWLDSGSPGTQGELHFLALLPNSGGSDLCAVGYRALWDAEAKCYKLMRRFLDSREVFARISNSTGPASRATFFPTATAAIANEEEEAARYVCGLTFHRDPGNTPRPEWIEVRFKALGPAAARKLAALPITQAIWEDPTSPLHREHIAPYLETFSTRVYLIATAKE